MLNNQIANTIKKNRVCERSVAKTTSFSSDIYKKQYCLSLTFYNLLQEL